MLRRLWYRYWIKLAYSLRLRGPANAVQRWFVGEHRLARSPLPQFDSLKALADYSREHFVYRPDGKRILKWVVPLDWVTHQEVFQARLERKMVGLKDGDGDCDDLHNWVAHVLRSMEDVHEVYLLSVGYRKGGHTCTVFRYGDGWWLFDYRLYALRSPNNAPRVVAQRYGGHDDPYWYVFETLDPPWRAVAIGPETLVTDTSTSM